MARATRTAHVRPPVLDGSAGIYLFYGDEQYLRRTCLHKLIASVLGADGSEMGVSQFDGAEVALAAVLDELRTAPFLSPRRVVIVQDADGFISEHRGALEKYAEKPVSTGVLVLLADRSQPTSNLQKTLAERGGVVACDRLERSDLAGWIRQRATEGYSKSLDLETASLLADLVGEDLDRLDSELAKLATYLGKERKAITSEDVDELVANQRLHEAFELTGAIASKDAAAAMIRWNDMAAKDPDADYRSIGLLAWQVRQMLRARLLRAQGLSRDEVLGKLRIPFGLRERFADQIRQFSDRRLRALIRELVKVDLAAKTGGAPPHRGIEQFIVVACQK